MQRQCSLNCWWSTPQLLCINFEFSFDMTVTLLWLIQCSYFDLLIFFSLYFTQLISAPSLPLPKCHKTNQNSSSFLHTVFYQYLRLCPSVMFVMPFLHSNVSYVQPGSSGWEFKLFWNCVLCLLHKYLKSTFLFPLRFLIGLFHLLEHSYAQ